MKHKEKNGWWEWERFLIIYVVLAMLSANEPSMVNVLNGIKWSLTWPIAYIFAPHKKSFAPYQSTNKPIYMQISMKFSKTWSRLLKLSPTTEFEMKVFKKSKGIMTKKRLLESRIVTFNLWHVFSSKVFAFSVPKARMTNSQFLQSCQQKFQFTAKGIFRMSSTSDITIKSELCVQVLELDTCLFELMSRAHLKSFFVAF